MQKKKAVRRLEVNEGLLVLPSFVEDLMRTTTKGEEKDNTSCE